MTYKGEIMVDSFQKANGDKLQVGDILETDDKSAFDYFVERRMVKELKEPAKTKELKETLMTK